MVVRHLNLGDGVCHVDMSRSNMGLPSHDTRWLPKLFALLCDANYWTGPPRQGVFRQARRLCCNGEKGFEGTEPRALLRRSADVYGLDVYYSRDQICSACRCSAAGMPMSCNLFGGEMTLLRGGPEDGTMLHVPTCKQSAR